MNNISEIQIQILALDKLHIHVPAKQGVIWGRDTNQYIAEQYIAQ